MKKQKIGLKHKNKTIKINVKKVNEFQKGIGLMFSSKENAKILLFEFKKQTRINIHSFFVFFSFLAIWLDKENNVLEIKKVNPWKISVSPKKPFYKLIEIPFNKKK